ncbi:FUSC family protein [Deinococcus sp. SDU3-2]|uniref:FUSC family protein n=1 Tax=Deinococcus terrestris TaxID=2651870 RepID=A0A7X1NTJ4_9DEIO|nr:FUSC family protein [Deinococcus terrestris]MPY65269.1 FUSC family protein [Deinococcus terrestris]
MIRELLRLGPAQRDHLPAGRIALGVAVPLLTLLWWGRLDLSIYASFAAFTGIYARHEPLGTRLRHQSTSAALLLACEALGIWLAQTGTGPWGVTLAGALVSGVGAVLAAALGLRPAGSLFFVFAVTSIAGLSRPAPFGEALGVAAATAVFCLGLGVLGALLSERVRPDELQPPSPSPLDEAGLSWHSLRHVLAAGLGGAAGLLSPFGHSAWAMVAAVAPISAQDHRGRVQRGLHRIVGTLGGVGVAAVVLALPPSPWLLVGLIVVLQFLAEVFVTRNYSVSLLFVTPLALLMTQLTQPGDPAALLTARAAETVLGALIGLAVVVLVRSGAERRDG